MTRLVKRDDPQLAKAVEKYLKTRTDISQRAMDVSDLPGEYMTGLIKRTFNVTYTWGASQFQPFSKIESETYAVAFVIYPVAEKYKINCRTRRR